MDRDIRCPYCNEPAELTDSAEIYNGVSYGMIWLCRPCHAYVGTHKNSKTHAPLGRLANAELREAKKLAHLFFDRLWKSDSMKRKEAYQWLADKLDIPVKSCHIGMFDVEQCNKVVRLCR